MNALWLENQTPSVRSDVPVPQPGEREALVRVRLAGVCSTDLEMTRGYYPFTGIIGHEFVGEIAATPGAPERIGQRVVGEINVTCGECEPCRAGRQHHCLNRTVIGIHDRNGCFAEYITLPLQNLHAVPGTVPDEAAVFTEPLAAAVQIQSQVHIQPDMHVLVIGAGRLGLLAARSLALTGCDLRVVARSERARGWLEAQGIAWVEPGGVQAKSVDLVVEATGSADGFTLAAHAVRSAGTIVMKSTFKGDVALNLSALVVDEVTLVGSRCGSFAPALRLLEQGLVDPTGLIDACYPLEKGTEALEHAALRGTIKVLIKP